MKHYSLSIGQAISYKHPAPERTAKRRMGGVFADDYYQVWPTRQAMAKAIRKQQKREPRHGDWHALIKLTDTEGY